MSKPGQKPAGMKLAEKHRDAVTLACMQMVAGQMTPATPLGVAMQRLYEKDPGKFVDRMVALEYAYWASKKPDKAEWDGRSACPTCGGRSQETVGSGEALVAAESWLSEHGESLVEA